MPAWFLRGLPLVGTGAATTAGRWGGRIGGFSAFLTTTSGPLALAPFLGADNTAVADFDTDLVGAGFTATGAATGRTKPLAFLLSTNLDVTIGLDTDFAGATCDFAEDLLATTGLEEALLFGFEDDFATRNPSRFR